MLSANLTNLQVLITRPQLAAEQLAKKIINYGGEAIIFPCIKIEPINYQHLAAFSLTYSTKLIFTSQYAVKPIIDWLKHHNISDKLRNSISWLAIGPATAKQLFEHEIFKVFYPKSAASSEELLNFPQLKNLTGENIIIFTGPRSRKLLFDSLVKDNRLNQIITYQRIAITDRAWLPEQTNKKLAILATSGEIVDNLVNRIYPEQHDRLFNLPLVTVSDRIVKLAKKLGFNQIKLIASASDQDILLGLNELNR